ncbi:CBS domain-containing protein [Paraburkholderia terrae]|uniref:CBS domain-containing protein n=1 Tax=Paraburkholderia terrae TaxID=311230 RepID=A0ABM7TZA4_9BURK|nr:CBS domain-containing protein [Paraburkholderia terrae]BCZ84425.1 CBS domain-containing protein [Paraburkholderia terrae]BDC45677.1 CBS domain-containing protein [Paraburkholderia terrae]
MKAADICTREVITCPSGTTVLEACKIMRASHVGDIVAVEAIPDGKLRPKGIVTDRDIVLEVLAREVDAAKLFVDDVMSSPLVVVYDWEDVWQVAKRMRLHAIRRMPVVDEAGELVGVVSLDDLLDSACALLSELSLVAGRQPHFELKQRA